MNIKKPFHRVIACAAQAEDVWLPRVSALCPVASVVFALSMTLATSGWAQQSEAQIAAYIKQLNASDEKKRSQAIATLAAMSAAAVPQLIGAFKDPSVRPGALQVLNHIGPVALDALKLALRDPDKNIRIGAAYALQDLGSYAESAVPDLIAALKDNKENVRQAIANTLQRVAGPGSVAAVNDLVAALRDPDHVVRQAAASALGRIGPAASSASDALIEVVKKDNESAVNASWALGQVQGDVRATVPALIEALNHENVTVRINAAYALGRFARHAKESIPALTKALKHSDPLLRRAAAQALSNFGPEAGSAVRALMHALADPDAGVRQNVVVALGGIGPAAAPAVPLLKHWLNKGDIELRRRIAWALGSMGPSARAAIPSLKDVRTHDDPQLRREAYRALILIVPLGKQFIDILVEAIKSKDKEEVRSSQVFEELGLLASRLAYEPAKVLAQHAIEAMNSPDKDVREIGALSIFMASFGLQKEMEHLSTVELEQIITAIEQARSEEKYSIVLVGLQKALSAELKSRQSELVNRMYKLVTENTWVSGIAIYLVLSFGLNVLTLWLRPLWLLRFNEFLKPLDLKIPKLELTLPMRAVFIVGFFHYHPRVLDAWVAAHIDSVRDRFAKRRTVLAREVHISVPVIVDGNTVADFSGEPLRPSFAKRRTCLLIWGEGGSGKTSLACQVARWVMSEDAHHHHASIACCRF